MTTTYWVDSYSLSDGDTVTGVVDGRTWTVNGDDITLELVARSVRTELANALANTVTERWGIPVTPWQNRAAAPPAIFLDADDPFMELAAQDVFVWAYTVNVVVARGKHPATWDWFERIGPDIMTALDNGAVPGAMFHTFDAPQEIEVGEGRNLQVAVGHVTVKRRRDRS